MDFGKHMASSIQDMHVPVAAGCPDMNEIDGHPVGQAELTFPKLGEGEAVGSVVAEIDRLDYHMAPG